jgi:hypothetical protein
MPKFIITASVDAFANYQTVIEAADETEAREAARGEWEANSLAWAQTSVSEFDEIDFDNFPPEMVADDFTLEPETDLFAELLAAFKEAVAFHDGEENETLAYWDKLITRAERR